MDNFTHTFTALAMSKAGLERYSPYSGWLLFLGANAPDIDVFAGIGSGVRYIEWHRSVTHSLSAAPVLAAMVVGAVWLIRRQVKDHLLPAFLVALAGVLSHLLMDFWNPYGMRLLLPFSRQWLGLDTFPVFDFWVTPVMLACLGVPYLFRMISDEIGARRGSGRPGAYLALIFLLAWWGMRDFTHRRAVNILDSHVYRGLDPRRVSAYPDMTNPFLWHGVVDTGESFEQAEVSIFSDFDPTSARTSFPPDPHPALDAARKTRTGRAFLDFAAYPYIYVDRKEDGYEVVFRDLRYEYGTFLRRGAVARVFMDGQYRVLEEAFHFRDGGSR